VLEAERLFPDNPGLRTIFEQTLQSRISTKYNSLKQVQQVQNLTHYNTIYSEAGTNHSITSADQLSPKAYQAYEALVANDPVAAMRIQRGIFDANARGLNKPTDAQRMQFEELRGTIRDSDPVARKQGQTLVVEELNLTGSQKAQLRRLQLDEAQGKADNVGLNATMITVRDGLLNALRQANIKPGSKEHRELTWQFRGALDTELHRRMEAGEKLNETEKLKMANELLVRSQAGWFSRGKFEFENRGVAPVRVRTRDEALALPSGTRFITPQCDVRIRP
jgi:hypothetical protein